MFDYYVELRSDLLEIVRGTHDASQGWGWDNTRPNYLTRGRLDRLFLLYTEECVRFGAQVVHRHGHCGDSRHSQLEHGYVIVDGQGRQMKYQDPAYTWHLSIWQGSMNCKCPCSDGMPVPHHVLKDVIIAKGTEACEALPGILASLMQAMDCASEKSPRSGIRERLLITLLQVNDAIMPFTVDDYIRKQRLLLTCGDHTQATREGAR